MALDGRHTVRTDVGQDLEPHRGISLHGQSMHFTAYGPGGEDDVLAEGTYEEACPHRDSTVANLTRMLDHGGCCWRRRGAPGAGP